MSYLKLLNDSPVFDTDSRFLLCPPTLFWSLQIAWTMGTVRSSLSIPCCFSPLCVFQFCPLCLEFPTQNPFPSFHPYWLPSILLDSVPAGEKTPFCMDVSVIATSPYKRLFCYIKVSLSHRPVALRSGWTWKLLGLQPQRLWLSWFGRGPEILFLENSGILMST